MAKNERYENSGLSLMDAVEVLSEISEFDFEQGLEEILSEIPEQQRIIWLRAGGDDGIVPVMRETLHSILMHFRQIYNQDKSHEPDPKNIEGMKTIMVMVGEAAKKLDRFTNLFRETKEKSITGLKEYHELQEFYLKKMARKIDEGQLGKWILGLAQRTFSHTGDLKRGPKVETEASHVFVDLESVKSDNEYELFFMRKEDGTRFFSPRLLRNVKLVCDFGDILGEKKFARDPLIVIPAWKDRIAFSNAKTIIESVSELTNQFYKEAIRFNDKELVAALNKALMALFLCADPHHLTKEHPVKCSDAYFSDFQVYLRDAISTQDFHKLLTYPPKKEQKVSLLLLNLSQRLCEALFTQLKGLQGVKPAVQGLLMEANEVSKKVEDNTFLWNHLKNDYAAMASMMKQHAQGPLIRILDTLDQGGYQKFDPLLQHNIPDHLYNLHILNRGVSVVRMACPTEQEFIHKAKVVDEFKEFLRILNHEPGRKQLMINLQDSTSWREHSRCAALEELQKQEEFIDVLSVVTLSTDSEFYLQEGVYANLNKSSDFIEQFKEHLEGEGFGYYFPLELKRQLFPGFVDGVMKSIHQVFFTNRNVLRKEDRLEFVEIFYLFLQLKLMELVQPDYCSFICKDGVDTGEMNSVLLYVFAKFIKGEEIAQDEVDLMIYGPALIVRERLPLQERFNRMVNTLKNIEIVRNELGNHQFASKVKEAFGQFFKGI